MINLSEMIYKYAKKKRIGKFEIINPVKIHEARIPALGKTNFQIWFRTYEEVNPNSKKIDILDKFINATRDYNFDIGGYAKFKQKGYGYKKRKDCTEFKIYIGIESFSISKFIAALPSQENKNG